MKLLFIRHADPDYELDSLTPYGWKEAKALADYLQEMEVTEYFVSPLGRAQATASVTMQQLGREATMLPWLTEFTHPTPLKPSYPDSKDVPWDWKPADWTKEQLFFDQQRWMAAPEMVDANIAHHHAKVIEKFDNFLAERGYERRGRMYHTDLGHDETYVFFCHLGTKGILLGHLLHLSPMVLWHSLCAVPSSISTVVTEERQKSLVSMRMLSYGATPHLEKANLAPSFAARFCETYEMHDQRH